MTTRHASRAPRRIQAALVALAAGVVLLAGCTSVSHPGRLDRSPTPSGDPVAPASAPPATPSPSATVDAQFVTQDNDLLAMKTPFKIGDQMGPDLPWSGPPPTTDSPTQESALLFMRAYMASRTVSLYKMSPDPVAAYLAPGCPCRHMLDLINQHAARGQHIEGPSMVINELHVNQVRVNEILVGVGFSQDQDYFINKQGDVVDYDPSTSNSGGTYTLDYDPAKGTWLITQAFG